MANQNVRSGRVRRTFRARDSDGDATPGLAPGRLTARRVTARAWSASAPASSDEGASKTFIKRYPLVARGSGTQCVMKARNVHDIRTDVPKAMGGADEAPSR